MLLLLLQISQTTRRKAAPRVKVYSALNVFKSAESSLLIKKKTGSRVCIAETGAAWEDSIELLKRWGDGGLTPEIMEQRAINLSRRYESYKILPSTGDVCFEIVRTIVPR